MIIKFFDKLHYKLSLSEEHINDIIKSNSKYGADIKREDYSYDVKFTDKGFKMKFVPAKNYGGIYSLSPKHYIGQSVLFCPFFVNTDDYVVLLTTHTKFSHTIFLLSTLIQPYFIYFSLWGFIISTTSKNNTDIR